MSRVSEVLLSFDMAKIPQGDVISGEWLDSIYDAFMSQDFSRLPDGVRLVGGTQSAGEITNGPDFLNPHVYCMKCGIVHHRRVCYSN